MKQVLVALALLFGICSVASAQAPSTKTAIVGEVAGKLKDPARAGREIGYKIYYPKKFDGAARVVLMSHGGTGNDTGELRTMSYLGTYLAEHGFFAIALGHRASASNMVHRTDRPADVTFVIDSLEARTLTPPTDFGGTLLLDKVGHVGHSWGAYTANAVGGGTFDQGRFRDPRIAAIVPISPQGADQFGSFDRGPSDNTWRTVEVPSYILTGSVEMSGAPSKFNIPNWRAQGFGRYPADGARFLSVVPGQDHDDMGGRAAPEVLAFMAGNIEMFLDIYLRGSKTDPCRIGSLRPTRGVSTERKMPTGSAASASTCSGG